MEENNYYYYCIARNKAWDILSECEISSLPLDLNIIKKKYGIKIIPYSKAKNYYSFTNEMKLGDGFSIQLNGQKIIYFNDNGISKARIRFTIAHELGHCLLGHDLRKIKYRNSESDDGDSIEEMQANVFARDILMPAVVLHFKKCLNYKKIMIMCGVSKISAKIRAERMRILEKRNKFCINEKEIKVYNIFFKKS